jgi:hypothetical protein
VGYDGVVAEALRAIVRWVEDEVPPAPTTSYRYTSDSGLALESSASTRGGVQPVVRAQANDGRRADVVVGEPVRFRGTAEQPPGTGRIVSASWDYTGTGDFVEQPLDDAGVAVDVETEHVYDAPGTYFASFRVAAQPADATATVLAIENGARVRVVVTEA